MSLHTTTWNTSYEHPVLATTLAECTARRFPTANVGRCTHARFRYMTAIRVLGEVAMMKEIHDNGPAGIDLQVCVRVWGVFVCGYCCGRGVGWVHLSIHPSIHSSLVLPCECSGSKGVGPLSTPIPKLLANS
jgi:hypothetical protein